MPIVPNSEVWVSPPSFLPPHGWESEDIYYPDHSYLLVSPLSDFLSSLEEIFTVFAVNLYGHNWMRDPMIRIGENVSFALASFDPAELVSYDPPPRRLLDCLSEWPSVRSMCEVLNQTGVPFVYGKYLTQFLMSNLDYMAESDDRLLGIHSIPLSGGNLITARGWTPNYNLNAGLVCIVGKQAAFDLISELNEAEIAKLLRLFPHSNEDHAYNRLRNGAYGPITFPPYLAATRLISKMLHPICRGRVCFPIQWSYHIDLSMAYIGAGFILVHDFKLAIDVVEHLIEFEWAGMHPNRRERMQRDLQEIMLYCRVAHGEYQSYVDDICVTLAKSGLRPIRVPGILLATRVHHGSTCYNFHAHVLSNRLAYNLMNLVSFPPQLTRDPSGRQLTEIVFRLVVPGPANSTRDPVFTYLIESVERCIIEGLTNVHRETRLAVPNVRVLWKVCSLTHSGETFAGFPFDTDVISPPPTPTGETSRTTATFMTRYMGGLRCQVMPISRRIGDRLRQMCTNFQRRASRGNLFDDTQMTIVHIRGDDADFASSYWFHINASAGQMIFPERDVNGFSLSPFNYNGNISRHIAYVTTPALYPESWFPTVLHQKVRTS